ncbi:MAG TPA: GNAT family N-acetyltransferase [Candidatus Nanoarchaeia archaeon]|nr:GNAT family N-acetyltransferase [Candidatus Nanoarchaeia archaeon]
MSIINLKQGNLEQKLSGLGISSNDKEGIVRDVEYYDEYYYLTESKKVVKGFRQEFVKDPYMSLSPIPEVLIIACDARSIEAGELEEVIETNRAPIITRVKIGTNLKGFTPIYNYAGNISVLLPLVLKVPLSMPAQNNPNVHQMGKGDLPEVIGLFRKQYSLRYKMVNLMWEECPEACFTYKKENRVVGVTFNKIAGNEFYMRQIFVGEDSRGKGIGMALYEKRIQYAMKQGISIARANIREEAKKFHETFNAETKGSIECYMIRR